MKTTDPDFIRAVLPVFIAEMRNEGVEPDFENPFTVFTLRMALALWTDTETEMSASEAWHTAWAEREAWREVTSRGL